MLIWPARGNISRGTNKESAAWLGKAFCVGAGFALALDCKDPGDHCSGIHSNALPHIFNEATCFIMLRMISLHSVRLLCVSLLVFSDLKVRQELGMLYEAISHFVRYLGGSE